MSSTVVVLVGFAISWVVGGRIDEDLRRERKVIITREQCCSSTQVAARAELQAMCEHTAS